MKLTTRRVGAVILAATVCASMAVIPMASATAAKTPKPVPVKWNPKGSLAITDVQVALNPGAGQAGTLPPAPNGAVEAKFSWSYKGTYLPQKCLSVLHKKEIPGKPFPSYAAGGCKYDFFLRVYYPDGKGGGSWGPPKYWAYNFSNPSAGWERGTAPTWWLSQGGVKKSNGVRVPFGSTPSGNTRDTRYNDFETWAGGVAFELQPEQWVAVCGMAQAWTWVSKSGTTSPLPKGMDKTINCSKAVQVP